MNQQLQKKEILFDFDNYDDMNSNSKEAELVNEDFIKHKDTYNTELGDNGGWNSVNDKPHKWIYNPYLGKNKKLYEDTISQCMASAGWTYGMLSKANMSSIEDIDGSVIPVKAFATKYKLKPYLVFQCQRPK